MLEAGEADTEAAAHSMGMISGSWIVTCYREKRISLNRAQYLPHFFS